MQRQLPFVVLVACLFMLTACSPKYSVKPVGSDYTLVWREPMNPDDHPGTALHYKGKQVWPNIYPGYGCFSRNGTMVFVGAVPAGEGYWPYPQLFAVRDGGLPMVLSQRLLHQSLTFSDSAPHFAVNALLFTNDYFQVEFKQSTNLVKYDFTWSDVEGFVNEEGRSAKLMRHSIADYQILP